MVGFLVLVMTVGCIVLIIDIRRMNKVLAAQDEAARERRRQYASICGDPQETRTGFGNVKATVAATSSSVRRGPLKSSHESINLDADSRPTEFNKAEDARVSIRTHKKESSVLGEKTREQINQIYTMVPVAHEPGCDILGCRKKYCFQWEPDKIARDKDV